MNWLFNICRKLNSFIQLNWSFIALFILSFLLESVKIYFLYVVFIVLHELCHFVVAKKLGYLPAKLKLTMFGASLEGFDDFLLNDEVKIIIAGPLCNFSVMVFCYLSFWFFPESFEILNDVLKVNQSILFFNLLPIFPLDAGRLLVCFASLKKGRKYGVKISKRISFMIILCLFFISILSFMFTFSFMLGFVSVNLCVLLFDTSSGTSYKREIVFRKKMMLIDKGVMQKLVYVKNGYPKELLLKFLDAEHYTVFVFVDECFQEKGRIEERGLLESLGFI